MSANATPGSNVYTTESAPNKYGAPPNNGNRQPLNVDNAISTQDYTGRAMASPDATQDLTSPQTLSTSVVTTLIIPPNATKIHLIGAVAFQVSEYWTGSGTLSQYALVPANTEVVLETGRQKNLYLLGGSAGNVSFWFDTL